MGIQDLIQLIAERWELELRIQTIEKWLAAEIEEKDRIINKQEEEIQFLRSIIKNLSQQTVIKNNIEVQMTSSSESQGDTYKQSGNFGIGHMSGGEIQEGAKVAGILNEAEQQSLAQAAAEIQQLLEQLEESNPTATAAEKQAFVTAALPLTKRERLVGAVKAGGKAAIEEFLDNPYLNTTLAIIEGWRNPN